MFAVPDGRIDPEVGDVEPAAEHLVESLRHGPGVVGDRHVLQAEAAQDLVARVRSARQQ